MSWLTDATREAMAMLLRADTAADASAREGLLALLGEGAGALTSEKSLSILRLIGKRGALLTPKQAAAALGVSRATLYRWEEEGRIKLRRYRIGKRRVALAAADVAAIARKMENAGKRREGK